ncbi:MAG: proteasome subunit beta, partial [Acidobacteria bacterium]|nr:proteasome subunit beta [Acidobacteriota bacterium]
MSHVSLPLFDPSNDPGPDFLGLVRKAGLDTPQLPFRFDEVFTPTHATTVRALRYDEGV